MSEDDGSAAQTGGIADVKAGWVTAITDAQGPVTANQIAFYIQSASRGAEEGFGPGGPLRLPRLVPEDMLADLADRFVAPPGFGEVVHRLRRPGTVVVSGPAGCGRRSAALMALSYSGEGATRFRELPDDDTTDEFVLDPGGIETGERLLLDLSTGADSLSQRGLSGLRAYRAVVTERKAFLAIVLPPELRHAADELGTDVVEIGRPEGRQVFHRHVRALDVPVTEDDLDTEALAEHFGHDPMQRLAAMAALVRRERNAAAGAGRWPDWLAAALAPDNHREAVARFVREHPDGRVRALLLAAAMYEYGSPNVVNGATTALLDVVGYPPPEGHRLDRPDLAESLRVVHATVDRRQVRFDTITYAHAVRTHFWATFPDLRDQLRRWVDRCARELPGAHRVEALLRYTEQCLLNGHLADLCTLVETWAARTPGHVDPLLDAAGPALTRGLLDERYGQWFRRRVYDWATNRKLWPSLASLLIGLCEGVVAPARPQQALVRLRHFTRHSQPDVVYQARAALVALATDGSFARRLLARVGEDLGSDYPFPVDYELFTDVADPVRLTTVSRRRYPHASEPETRRLLVDCWAAVLGNRPYSWVVVAVRPWLDAHADDPRRELLLDVLADAAGTGTHAPATLYAATRDWVTRPDADPDIPPARRTRLRTATLLRHKCDAAAPGRRVEGARL